MKKYIVNSLWMLLERIFKLIFTFVFIGLIAKQVGTTDFGMLSLALSIVAVTWTIASLGFDNVLLKEFSQKQFNESELFSTVFYTRILSSLLCVIIIFIGCGFYFGFSDATFKIICMLLLSVPFYNSNTFNSYYQAKSKSRFITKISFVSLIISLLFKTYLLFMHKGLLWFAFSFTFDVVINFVLIYFFSSRFKIFTIKINHFKKEILKNLFFQSFPLLLASVIIIVYTRLDQFMVAYYLGFDDTGIYSVAIRISEAYAFVPTLIATSFYPMVAEKLTKENVQFYFDIVFLSAFITGLCVILVAPFIIPILFGYEYQESIFLLNIMVISTLFAVIGGVCTNCLVIQNLGYFRLIRIILGLIINGILNIILIPKYGMFGAVFAGLTGQVFSSWLGNYFSKRTLIYGNIETKTIFTLGLGCLKINKLTLKS